MNKTSLFGLAAAVLLSVTACGPQAFVIYPEMRAPSKSGLNLTGKSMAVVYSAGENTRNAAFNSAAANGFASKLEEEYFGGEQVIPLYLADAADTSLASKDSMVKYVMETGQDVVFLFTEPALGVPTFKATTNLNDSSLPSDSTHVTLASVPFTTAVYVYDSMNKEDKVRGFTGSRSLSAEVYTGANPAQEQLLEGVWKSIAPGAEAAGSLAAAAFAPEWKSEEFYVIYYEGYDNAWTRGAEHAHAYEWDEAIKDWSTILTSSKSPEKCACVSYNIALACFMYGQYSLALEWLDRADDYYPVNIVSSLRKTIKEYSE